MWRHRNSVLGGWLTAGILLAPLTYFALQAAPANAQGKGQAMQEKLAWLGQELQLSDKQKKKVRPMLQEMQTQLMAVKGNPNLSPEQRKAKALPIVQNTMSSIRTKVLNKEQRAKYDAMKEQAIQRMMATRGGGAAPAPGAGHPAPGGPPQ